MIRAAGLILNPQNPKAIQCAEKAEEFLRRSRIPVVHLQSKESSPTPELIVSFGGDGTLLLAAQFAVQFGAPLLGINLGTVGFLTEEDPERTVQALQAIMEEKYQTEERSLLHIEHVQSGKTFFALNDAVITRGGYARLIRVDVYVNNRLYGKFTADGIIVATPTGSTGYSLSAGGPIVEPCMNCRIITPVCAHSMKHCPCVVSESSRISLRLNPEREQSAELQIDGRNRGALSAGDEILITGTPQRIRLIRLHQYDFFGLMRRKLDEWSS